MPISHLPQKHIDDPKDFGEKEKKILWTFFFYKSVPSYIWHKGNTALRKKKIISTVKIRVVELWTGSTLPVQNQDNLQGQYYVCILPFYSTIK